MLELFLDDQMDSEMLKAKQSQMNQQLEVLDQQIKEAQQANQSQDEIPNFDKLKDDSFDDNTIQRVKKGYTRKLKSTYENVN